MPFYPHILRYLESHDKEKIGEIFAMIIEACHDLVPPEEIKPLIERIINNYITEYCNNSHITVGLNTIRELLNRMPLALDESQIEYLVQFKTFKNASVVAAAKSLINYFRDVCPNLLPKRLRGRFTKIDEDNDKKNFVYGKQKINFGIEGIELLEKAEGAENLATTRILGDEDLKKLKILKLRQAVKKLDRKGFASSEDEKEAEDVKEDEGQDISSDEEEEDDSKSHISIDYDEEEDGDNDNEDGEEESEVEDYDSETEAKQEKAKRSQSVMKPLIKKMFADSDSDDADVELSESHSMSIGSSDLAEAEEEEEANPHGFVFAHHLDTFKKTKRERLEDQRKNMEDKDDHRGGYKKKRDKKGGGSTNKLKLKNKPFNMIKRKKIDTMNEKF